MTVPIELIERGVDEASATAVIEVRKRRRDKGRLLYQDRLLKVSYKDTARSTSDRLKITLDNGDGLLFGDDLLMSKGTLVRLKFGYPGNFRDAGDFVLKKRIPSGRNLEFECHEAKRSSTARKLQVRHWTNARRSEVVRQTLQRLGYTGGFLEVDRSDLVLPIIIQNREGDYQFIERLAEEEAKEFWIDADGAHWVEPARNERPSRTWKYKRGLIPVGNVVGDPTIEDFGSSVPGRITFGGIDPLTGEEYVVKASDSDDPNEQVKGLVKLVSDTDTFMTPEEGDEEASGNDGMEIVMNVGSRTKEEAKLAADELYKKYRYSALKVKIPLILDPFLRPRKTADVLGLGPAIDGRFYIREVQHEIQPGVFARSTVELNKDGLNLKRKRQINAAVRRDYRTRERNRGVGGA